MMHALYTSCIAVFTVVLSSFSPGLAAELEVISVFSESQSKRIVEHQSNVPRELMYTRDLAPSYRHTIRHHQNFEVYEFDRIATMLEYYDTILVHSNADAAFSLLEYGDSRLTMQGIVVPITGANFRHSVEVGDYTNGAYFENLDAYFVLLSRDLEYEHAEELESLERVLFQSSDSILNQSLGGHGIEYFRMSEQFWLKADANLPDYLKVYQEVLGKKGCGCGPSSSCYSLSLEKFGQFLLSKKSQDVQSPHQVADIQC